MAISIKCLKAMEKTEKQVKRVTKSEVAKILNEVRRTDDNALNITGRILSPWRHGIARCYS